MLIRSGLDNLTEYEEKEGITMDIETMLDDEFNLVNMIVKETRIVTNESMIVRVQRLHKELAINCGEWQEDFIKLMLELNEPQLTTLEGFLIRNHLIQR